MRSALFLVLLLAGCTNADSPTEPRGGPTAIPPQAVRITAACGPAHFIVSSATRQDARYLLWHDGQLQGDWRYTAIEAGRPLWIGTVHYRGRVGLMLDLQDGSLARQAAVTCDDDAPNPYSRRDDDGRR